MLDRLTDYIARRPLGILALVGVVTLGAAFIARGVDFDFRPESVHSGHDQMLSFAEEFRRKFPLSDSLILVVLHATGDRDVLTRDALTWQDGLTRRLGGLPGVERVDSLTSLRVPRPKVLPPFWSVVQVVRDHPVSAGDEARVREVVARLQLVRRVLVSADDRTSAIVIRPADDSDTQQQALVTDVLAAVKDRSPPPGYEVLVTGLPYLRQTIIADMRTDQVTQIPGVAILFLLLLAIIFRWVAGAILSLTAVGVAIVWLVALITVSGLRFNLITNVIPALLLIVGTSNCVHIVCRYLEELRDREPILAAKVCLQRMGLACLLACATTAIGFASLCWSRSDLLREFAWEAMCGVGLLYISAMLCLGAGMPLFSPSRRLGATGLPTGLAMSLGKWAVLAPRRTLLAGAVAVGGCLWLASGVVVNSQMTETYPVGHPSRNALERAEQDLAGSASLEISLRVADVGRFWDPAVLRSIEQFESVARQEPSILLVRSYVNLLQQVAEASGMAEPHTLGAQSEEEVMRVVRRALRTADLLQLGSWLTDEGRQARISCRVRDAGSRETLAVVDRLTEVLDQQFPPTLGVDWEITGEAYLFARSMDGFVTDMFWSLCAASLAIFGVIALLFRSFRVGLIAAVPNLTPLLVTLAYMRLRGLDLNTSNVIVFAVSIGIAVDDTVHLLARFREEWVPGVGLREALLASLRHTGRAIVLTTLLIVLGLSVMLFSAFLPTRRFAELTCVTMAAALFGDLIWLPACIAVFWPRKQPGSATHDDRTARPDGRVSP